MLGSLLKQQQKNNIVYSFWYMKRNYEQCRGKGGCAKEWVRERSTTDGQLMWNKHPDFLSKFIIQALHRVSEPVENHTVFNQPDSLFRRATRNR